MKKWKYYNHAMISTVALHEKIYVEPLSNKQRVKTVHEPLQINSAFLYGLLKSNDTKLEKGDFYILDGARRISHEINFKDVVSV